jgi:hypothetical protein
MTDCYICYEKETSYNKFMTNPCQCKGTNKIHKTCLQELIQKNGSTCSICKSQFIIHEKIADTKQEDLRKVRIDFKPRYKPIESSDHYAYQEAPRIDSRIYPSRPIQNHSENNRYYRDSTIEIRAIDLGNGNFEIRYAPKHDCCCVIS